MLDGISVLGDRVYVNTLMTGKLFSVPILAGGADLMEKVGQRLQAHGFDVAFCARAGSALKPPQRGPELEELFRRSVLHQRLLLAWLRAPANDPPPALFALGMSLGGIIATAVAAVEPSLDGLAICLSGGDLGSLVVASGERRVQAWVWGILTSARGVRRAASPYSY